jgi:hypothetical protein
MHVSRIARVVLFGALAAMLAGCAAKPKTATTPPPASVDSARQSAKDLQAAYQKTDPTARVGIVLAVKPELSLVAVGDVPVKDFKNGDILSFMDSSQQLVANGRVTDTDNNLLIVKYDVLPSGGRAPRTGDLAIRVK